MTYCMSYFTHPLNSYKLFMSYSSVNCRIFQPIQFKVFEYDQVNNNQVTKSNIQNVF